MTQSILRVTLTALALLMLFAGSLNLKRTNAEGGLCDFCGCGGGTQQCCTSQGVTCYNTPKPPAEDVPVDVGAQ